MVLSRVIDSDEGATVPSGDNNVLRAWDVTVQTNTCSVLIDT
jgi:hypothetical protein